jgi:hypothetical protein
LSDGTPIGETRPANPAPVVAVPRPSLELPDGLTAEQEGLWKGTVAALTSLPAYFKSRLVITDVLATDLHAFNVSLGASIELQVIQSLNELRRVWDPAGNYSVYTWERQPQRFPDVVLRTTSIGYEPIVMGVEMKGWYVLSREREPSGRFQVGVSVCAPMDLLCIVPWALDAAVSGSPRAFEPWVVNASSAAAYRNFYWEHTRKLGARDAGQPRGIKPSTITTHYPTKDQTINDEPLYDRGGNFGRFARGAAMKTYIDELVSTELVGIPLRDWKSFLKSFGALPDEDEDED